MAAQTQQLTPELTLEYINEIPVLILNHPVGSARIALQGAQLLNWQPKGAEQDIFWLSDIEPFTKEMCIRDSGIIIVTIDRIKEIFFI